MKENNKIESFFKQSISQFLSENFAVQELYENMPQSTGMQKLLEDQIDLNGLVWKRGYIEIIIYSSSAISALIKGISHQNSFIFEWIDNILLYVSSFAKGNSYFHFHLHNSASLGYLNLF